MRRAIMGGLNSANDNTGISPGEYWRSLNDRNDTMAQRRLIPFPFPMKVGTDICYITRVESIMNQSQDRAARFIRRILAEEELKNPRPCIAAIIQKPNQNNELNAWKQRRKEAANFMAGRYVFFFLFVFLIVMEFYFIYLSHWLIKLKQNPTLTLTKW